MAGCKVKKADSRRMIEWMTCRAENLIDDMNEGMMIVQGGRNELPKNGKKEAVNAIMNVVERAQKKNVRVAVTSLLRRPACNGFGIMYKLVVGISTGTPRLA
ncbi:hypothetical protein FHG87_015661 [Trinorchestia longiramus]|nr:hypothetical protein FHG87_015661 [Trinorchestia longiramus]